ncbi:fibronectin type III domain-containing protein [Paenibacillus sp. SYP-B3998]|uniref:Fibronectin type III domain-containing protein n=2 Tax=Paenibacillus sp. SYP-B3998 TaxID=2678564 RepID=A0A6G4A821_9BACL|nr:fibronectin type III domain-containing protein [Paenibacillus sp. SYP-B3998]
MSIKLRSSNASYDRKGYVKFNTSSLSGPVSSAALKLYVTNIHSNTTSYTLEAKGISNDGWSESTLNATNQPSEAGTPVGTATVNQEGVYINFDVTAFINSQTDGAASFRLAGLNEDLGSDYATKENANAAARPILVVNGGGSSGGDTQAPSVPTNLTVMGKTSSSVSLTWNASTDNTGVTGYEVYNGSTLAATVPGTSATVSGLSPNTAYAFKVKAKDAAGNASGGSNQVSVTTDSDVIVGPGCTNALTSTAAIQTAMKNAKPGDVILIAPGAYIGDVSTAGDIPRTPEDPYGPGLFYSPKNGTSANHIVMKSCDPQNRATLKGVAMNDGSYGIHLTGDYWELRDLVIMNAQKGIVVDNGNHNLLNNVEVHLIGDEGVHFRDGSSYNTLEYSKIYDTGNYQAGYGEGAYVGSDESTPYEHIVIGNVIRYTVFNGDITAEHIDIKEGADGTIVEYCNFNGTGITGDNSADSFIDVKGINTVVRNNQGYRNGNANVVDAFQVRTHGSLYGTGKNNTFYNNTVNLDGVPGYVVYATSAATGTKAHDDVRINGGNLYNNNVNK